MDTERHRIAQDVLAYLTEHPDARDTLEGIAEWWLLERCVQRRLADLKRALDDLVDEGLVVRERRADSSVCYYVDRGKLPTIRGRFHSSDDSEVGR